MARLQIIQLVFFADKTVAVIVLDVRIINRDYVALLLMHTVHDVFRICLMDLQY